MAKLIERTAIRLLGRLRQAWWWITDPDYRRRHSAQRRRNRDFLAARQKTYPLIWRHTNGVVATGPFAGLRYIETRHGHYFTPKLIGTYERELARVIETICTHKYDTVIDIGAAEGYYVCGLAMRLGSVQVIAYESDEQWHPAIRELARLNGLEHRISVLGHCSLATLQDEVERGRECLVICDIDGGERDLLDPALVPALLRADLLVETHEARSPGAELLLRDRFSASHLVEAIRQERRTISDFPSVIHLPADLALKAMDEWRGPGNDWMWIRRSGPLL